jgi:hypothetical protein
LKQNAFKAASKDEQIDPTKLSLPFTRSKVVSNMQGAETLWCVSAANNYEPPIRLLQELSTPCVHTGRMQNLHGVPRPYVRKKELHGRAEAVEPRPWWSRSNAERHQQLRVRRLPFSAMFEPKLRGQKKCQRNAGKKEKKRSLDLAHWKKNVDVRKL